MAQQVEQGLHAANQFIGAAGQDVQLAGSGHIDAAQHWRVVGQHAEYDIGLATFSGRGGGCGALLGQYIHGALARVPHQHGLPGLQQICGHVLAHGAETDKGDGHY